MSKREPYEETAAYQEMSAVEQLTLQVSVAVRERDEARAEAKRLLESRDYFAECYERVEDERDELESQRDALERAMRDIYKHAPMGGHAHHAAARALIALDEGNDDDAQS